MPSSIVIRPLKQSDHAGWLPLWRGYLEFYREDPDQMPLDDTWQRLLGPDPVHGLCAETGDGTLVGLTHWFLHPDTWSPKPKCYLQDLYTAPAMRGQGVAGRLIDAVSSAAAHAGASKVYWLTENDNVTARRLYDRVAGLSPFVRYVKAID